MPMYTRIGGIANGVFFQRITASVRQIKTNTFGGFYQVEGEWQMEKKVFGWSLHIKKPPSRGSEGGKGRRITQITRRYEPCRAVP